MAEEPSPLNQIFPKTLAGMAMWFLIFAAGIAAAGVVLFFWYNFRLQVVKQEILAGSLQFDAKVQEQREAFDQLVKDSKAEIERAAGAGAQTNELTKLLEGIGPAIALVQGQSIDGSAASGSGFIVQSSNNDAWIVTTYAPLAGSIAEGKSASVTIGENTRQASVHSWDTEADLALVIVRTGGLPALTEWHQDSTPVGTAVWAVGASPGQLKSAASRGYLIDSSASGLLTNADIPTSFRGGPLVDTGGRILGVISTAYAPQGYAPSNGWVVPIQLTCRRVLRCPG